MKTLAIGWLNKCRCGNKSHTVKTARGNNAGLWDDDAVKCNSCGRGGVIHVCEGQARVLWETDEEMAENKPMSTITKQHELKVFITGFLTDPMHDTESANSLTAEVFRIALASLEAEPAIHRWRRVTVEPYGPYPWHYGNFIGFSKPVEGIEDEYFYSAPPAPVVPQEATPENIAILASTFAPRGVTYQWDSDECNAAADSWNACRAAMLQGAEQTNYRAIVERIAEIVHGKVTDIDLLTVTVKSMKDNLHGRAEPVTTAYKLPPHIFRELVNRLRDTAVKYQGCQQLREQLSRTLQEVIQPAASQQEVKP